MKHYLRYLLSLIFVLLCTLPTLAYEVEITSVDELKDGMTIYIYPYGHGMENDNAIGLDSVGISINIRKMNPKVQRNAWPGWTLKKVSNGFQLTTQSKDCDTYYMGKRGLWDISGLGFIDAEMSSSEAAVVTFVKNSTYGGFEIKRDNNWYIENYEGRNTDYHWSQDYSGDENSRSTNFLFTITTSQSSLGALATDGLVYNFADDTKEASLTASPLADAKYSGEITVPNSITYNGATYNTYTVTNVDNTAFAACSGLKCVFLPNTIKHLYPSSFKDCNALQYVKLPDVTSIPRLMFSGCTSFYGMGTQEKGSPEEITIPNSVTYIGDSAFYKCTKMTTVNFPSTVRIIGDYAFRETGLKSVVWPDSATTINQSVFEACEDLTSIKMPNTVTSIGVSAFKSCKSLKSIEIPTSVTNIEGYAFAGCSSLDSIDIPNSVTSIGFGAFQICKKLKKVCLANSISKIGGYAFNGCISLKSIDIPSSVVTIERGVFNGCTALSSVTIPESVTTIEDLAFNGASSLKSILMLSATPPTVSSTAFPAELKTVYVPNKAIDTYKKANVWKNKTIKGFCELTDKYVERTETVALKIKENKPGMKLGTPTWSSSDTSIATVDADGVVTALKVGTCTVTANVTVDGEAVTLSCQVNVDPISVKNVKILVEEEYTITNHEDKSLPSVEILPQSADHQDVSWKILDTSVAVIKTNASTEYISPLKPGTTYLVVNSIENPMVKDTCKLVVIPAPVTSITLPSTLTVAAKNTEKLTATTLPDDIGNSALKWSSSDETIATVDEEGNVKGIKEGTATITAATTDGSNVSATCQVNVTAWVPMSSLTLSSYYCKLGIGGSVRIYSTVAPATAIAKIEWSSSDNAVATVDQNGNVKALATGTATITATATDGSNLTATCEIIVKSLYDPQKDLKSVYKTLSSNTTVTLFGEGWDSMKSAINAMYVDGQAVTPSQTFTFEEQGDHEVFLKFNTDLTTLYQNTFLKIEGTDYRLIEFRIPSTVTKIDQGNGYGCHYVERVYSYNMTAPKAVMASPKGWYFSKALGHFSSESDQDCGQLVPDSVKTLFVCQESTGYDTERLWKEDLIGHCRFNVLSVLVADIQLEQASYDMHVGDSLKIKATVTPAIDSPILKWTSSNENVAVVDSTGMVTALGVGTAIIKAVSMDGSNIQDGCNITVKPTQAASIVLSNTTLSVKKNHEAKLSATVLPVTTFNKKLTWSSSNPTIATVDEEGNIKALLAGTAVIKAAATDGSEVVAECQLTVTPPLSGDSNDDDAVNIADAVNTVNYILDKTTGTFVFEAADVNSDGNITVSDVTGTISLIFAQNNAAPQKMAAIAMLTAETAEDTDDLVFMQKANSSVGVMLDHASGYAAFQADITLPVNAKNAKVRLCDALASTHRMTAAQMDDNTLRVAVYSLANNTLADGQELFTVSANEAFDADEVQIANAIAADTDAAAFKLGARVNHLTSVSGLIADTTVPIRVVDGGIIVTGETDANVNIYTTSGVLVKSLRIATDSCKVDLAQGVYLVSINGQTTKITIK